MKIFLRFFVIVLAVVSIYSARHDVVNLINRFRHTPATDVSSNLPSGESTIVPDVGKAINRHVDTLISKKVSTPGPLKVSTKVDLARLDSNEPLSILGIVNLTNEARLENGGVAALQVDARLNQSAKIKLDDMFRNQYFEHVSPASIGVAQLVDQVGYEFVTVGENLAFGEFLDDRELVAAWLASPGHRANILSPRFTEIGVAVTKGNYKGSLIWMAVQHFGLPLSACPKINIAIKTIIDQNKITIVFLGGQLEQMKIELEEAKEYNDLVNRHNQLINETRGLVGDYNASIEAFNTCVQSA